MKLTFNRRLAENYTSQSQKVRVLTEAWVDNSIFCPNCGHIDIDKYPNSQPVADFYCKNCAEEYELKSKKDKISNRILDGAYGTMIERLRSENNPNFFFLNYGIKNYEVQNFIVIPKHFFTPKIIIKRNQGLPNRPNYIMCSIDLSLIPQSGKIFYVKDKKIEPKRNVLLNWKKTLFLRDEKEISAKGWLLDTMRSIEKLGKREFMLDDIYAFEDELSNLHPENKHIKDKIRQQLQILRDKGYLDFVSRGYYRLT